MKKEEKAKKLFEGGKVKVDMRTRKRLYFIVESNRKHSIIFDKERGWFCDCKFQSLRDKECSHIKACKLYLINEAKKKS